MFVAKLSHCLVAVERDRKETAEGYRAKLSLLCRLSTVVKLKQQNPPHPSGYNQSADAMKELIKERKGMKVVLR